MEKNEIITRIHNKEMTAIQFIEYCKRIVFTLKQLKSDFKFISVWDDETNESFYFNDDGSDFDEKNLKKIIIEDKEIVYKNPDPIDMDLSMESKSWIGFSSSISFKSEKSDYYDLALDISQGAFEANKKASINIEFSDEFQKTLSKNDFLSIIKAIEETTDLYYAVVISSDFRRKVKLSGQKLWIGYLTYFDKKEIQNILAGYSLICTEKGVIIDINSNFSIDEKSVYKAIKVRDLLSQFSLLNQ